MSSAPPSGTLAATPEAPSGQPARTSDGGRRLSLRRAWRRLPIGRKGLVVVGLPLVATLLAVTPLIRNELRNNDVESQVRHSLEVRSSLYELAGESTAVESAARGYLLVGTPKLLAEFEAAKASTTVLTDEIGGLVSDNSGQTARLDAVRAALRERFAILDTLTQARPDGTPRALTPEVQQRGADLKVGLEASLDTIQRAEVDLLNARTQRAEDGQRRQLLMAGAAVALGMIAALGASALFSSGVARRVRSLERRTASIFLDAPMPAVAARRLTSGRQLTGRRRDTDELGELEAAYQEAKALIATRDASLRQEAARLAAVAEVQQAIAAGPLDAQRIMWGVVEPALELTGADSAAIVRIEGDELIWEAAVGGARRHLGTRLGGEWNLADLAGGVVLNSSDTTQDRGLAGRLIDPETARSLLASAIMVDGVVDCALIVYDRRPAAFDTGAERTVGVLAGLLSAALSHAAAFRARADALADREAEVVERRQAEAEAADARDAAEDADRAKSEFLSRMSHELRTPLNAVLGFGQLLELEDLTEDQRASVSQIIKAGYHLLDLINEVLDISRIEAGRISLSLEPVSVDEVLNEAIDLVRPLARGRDIELPTRYVPGVDPPTFVRADRQRLKQVMLNLLVNAVKYNHPRGRITVEVDEIAPRRRRISVIDTGPGISSDRLERLYVPFERLGAELSDVEGTGLGLALSKRLVEAMGGELDVASIVGQGTTFSVVLEAVVLEAGVLEAVVLDVPWPPDAVPERVSVPTVAADRRTVLYIEDNPANLRLVQQILDRRPTVSVISAMLGRLGIELARQHQPDLVLVDLDLPDVSGREVLATLRADPLTASCPVVVVSADATVGQAERLARAGATAYLTKPFDVGAFLGLVDDLLRPVGGSR